MNNLKIAFIGGGNMARSLISGLIKAGYDRNLISVSNRSEGKLIALNKDFGIKTSLDNYEIAKDADVIVLAVKPQFMAEMLNQLTAKINDYEKRLIISLAAGVTVKRLTGLLNGHKKIVRLMPNTPALIGYGVTGTFAAPDVNAEEKDFTNRILTAVGKVVWVENESDINTVTAASGSSPAYFFLFMQYLIEHTKEMGLSDGQARTLVVETALGAAQMAIKNADVSLETLRAQVTSKGGTTFAAISKFEELNLKDSVSAAMDACVARAEEMQKLF
jgi:pyrroline-5-carboxylate reductase